jgi:radical SAM superfamily enzyme YgiQ (UPF0313 family)
MIEDLGCGALRALSSYVKNRGHSSRVIFLPRRYSEGWGESISYRFPYSARTLEQVAKLCANSDIVGLSLMSCHFDNAVYLTEYLKKTINKPVIWGGVHPTIKPMECLNYADMVCVGEGELVLSALLERLGNGSTIEDVSVSGLITRANNKFSAANRLCNLDELGYPDFDMANQFVLYDGNVVPLNGEIYARYMNYSYRTTVCRGCLHDCSYCCNNVFKKLNTGKSPPIRWRSIDLQIEELRRARELMPGISQIDFADDTFLARPYEQIEAFARRYRDEIGLDFRILTSPLTVTHEKIKVLAEAGLRFIGIGVQSADEPTRRLYKRKESLERIKQAESVIRAVAKETSTDIMIRYDFIVDNPWTGEVDVEQSVRFALSLERPNELCVFSLVFYPETELYHKAKADGIIKDDLNESYRVTQLVPKGTYMNELLLLLSIGVPKWLVKLLLRIRGCPAILVRLMRKIFTVLIRNPRIFWFFLFMRFRHNRKQTFLRVWQKIKLDRRGRKLASILPRFEGRAGQISAGSISESGLPAGYAVKIVTPVVSVDISETGRRRQQSGFFFSARQAGRKCP